MTERVIQTRLDNDGRLIPISRPVPCRWCGFELPAGSEGSCPGCNELVGPRADDAVRRWQSGECGCCVKLDVDIPVMLPESELRARAERLRREGRMPTREQVEAVLTETLGPEKGRWPRCLSGGIAYGAARSFRT